MSTIRLIVCQHVTADDTLVEDTIVELREPFASYPGFRDVDLAASHGTAPAHFIVFEIPPDRDVLPHLDELAARGDGGPFELTEAGFGMHENLSVDYAIVLDGEIWLRVPGSAEIHLHAGDCVVQVGARHAWRNHGTTRCRIAAVMVPRS